MDAESFGGGEVEDCWVSLLLVGLFWGGEGVIGIGGGWVCSTLRCRG